MIDPSELESIRASLVAWRQPGLPRSLAEDCARLLNVSDTTISLLGDTDRVTLCASSESARTLDEWEFTFQEGPGADVATTSATATASTAPGGMNPWPRLAVKAQAFGYSSIAGIPLMIQGSVFATLNLQERDGIISPQTIAAAQHLADEMASAIVNVLSQQSPSTDQPADHAEFHQATGMVMFQMQIDADAAAEVLRAYAWTHDLPLMDVAAEVIGRTITFPAEPRD